ncbi:M48 family metallopeptidase [Stackebrandtia nassauensis]|uniref:Ste24 endopeptidase n=1 Tax=Stackebrandtia nassauensis (strain DSM 44728 / CIP 108903 / NRRL B-16338 / NBRC 102104 / LLR-40K-21) TaxID=446470 RepID=D3Q8S6_STANL|nr:M48 family metallopeptidase [Stackebrandtia nassauensis]ADD44518.1 Ste24 endopeptidase [Stackebrandtia nassauensis DSM 44728]
MVAFLRQPAAIALLVLLGALLIAGALLVPWGDPPVPSAAAQAKAVDSLPAGVVATGKEFAAALRPGSYIALGLSLAVALLLGLTTLGAKLVALGGRPFGGHWLAEAVLGGLLVVLVSQVVTLPLSAWSHSIRVRFGMSTQSWGQWAMDVGKSYLVTIVLSALALAAFYTVIRFAPKWWWAWTAVGAGLLVVVMSALYPLVIEPVFNSFKPMGDSALRTELMDMAEADGVPVKDVLVSDASIRTNAVNAYVSGLGPTRRIVVYDNLLKAPDKEVASVVAHELGHAKANDVWIGTALAALGTAAAVCAIALLANATGLLRRAGADTITSPRALALILAFVAVVGLLTTPLQSAVSRRMEMRADAHALELTKDPATFAEMQANLAASNKSDVDPPGIIHWLFGSHPTTAQRIAMAKAYGD